ncbi:MAG: hypothetical protein AAF490_04070 [Chloroflexota bacterium]
MFTYTLLFNRATKQTIYDLLMGTFVIQTAEQPITTQPSPALPTLHRRVLMGIGAFVVVMTFSGAVWGDWVIGRIQPNVANLSELQQLQAELHDPALFHSVSVNVLTRTNLQTENSLTDLEVLAWLRKDCQTAQLQCDKIIDSIAHQVFEQYDDIRELDGMTIRVMQGMDLGLITSRQTQGAQFRIESWEERLGLE